MNAFPKPMRRRSAKGDGNKEPVENRTKHGRTPQSGKRPGPARGARPRPERELESVQEPRETVSVPEDRKAPLLPGIKPVLELLQSAPERVDTVFLRKGRHSKDMDRIVDLCRSGGVRFSLLEPGLFSRVYDGHSQGVVARLFEAGYVEWDTMLGSAMDAPLPLILALDQVQDPGNAGTLARTLYALGGAGLVAPRHNGVYLGAAAAKASAGALERLPVSRVSNLGQALDSAKKLGFTIYGAASGISGAGEPSTGPAPAQPVLDIFSLDAAHPAFRLPAILVLGGEEGGMRPGMEKRCDYLVRVPMLRDFDSLNVAQAGGIIIGFFAGNLLSKKR